MPTSLNDHILVSVKALPPNIPPELTPTDERSSTLPPNDDCNDDFDDDNMHPVISSREISEWYTYAPSNAKKIDRTKIKYPST
jgi:hypothetical protein